MEALAVTTSDGAVSFDQDDGVHSILQAALRAGVPFPYECSSGGCGTCRYTPVSGEIDVLWEAAPGLSNRDRRKGVQLACQTRARSDLEITVRLDETCRPVVPTDQFVIEMEDRRDLTHDISEFTFRGPDAARFLPGQYAILKNDAGVRRCYSMCNTANDAGVWAFQIKLVPGGCFTPPAFDLRPGVKMTLDGPYGLAYYRPESPRDVLCIAGGSGLSPMVSIARGLAEDSSNAERRLHFFYGGRTAADIVDLDALAGLGNLHGRMHYIPVVSEPTDVASQAWPGQIGFVHEAVVETLGPSMAEMEVYFAGPPPMTEATQRALMLDHGVPFEQLHFDRFF